MAAKMRTMTHHGRGKGKGGMAYGSKHDDRNFDITKADNIAPELTPENLIWHIYQDAPKDAPVEEKDDEKRATLYAPMNWRLQGMLDEALGTDFAAQDKARFFGDRERRQLPEPGPDMTFDEVELRFYHDHFSEQLEETNAKYRANGHPERCKTMAAWKQSRRNAPAESVFQIGDKHNTGLYADAATLRACFEEYEMEERRWNDAHGNPFTLLNAALHVDEPNCPPHIHSRRVWHYKAEDGSLRLGQEKALEMAGVELPDPSQPPGRRNNRKMAYDAMMREKWLDILKRHGIEVETEPLPSGKGKQSKTREQHIQEKYNAMSLEAERQAQRAVAAEKRADAAEARADAAEDREKAAQEQIKALQAQMAHQTAVHQEMLRVNAENMKVSEENLKAIKKQEEVIQEQDAIIEEQEYSLGLIQDYEEYCSVADMTDHDLDTVERIAQKLPPPKGLFRPAEEKEWLRDMKSMLDKVLYAIGEGIRRLRIFESRNDVPKRRSEPAEERSKSVHALLAEAYAKQAEQAATRETKTKTKGRSR